MTIIEKLSDRGGFIYEAILIIVKNNPPMKMSQLQYELLKCGVYIKAQLLQEAIEIMNRKKLLINEKKDSTKETSTSQASAPIVQLEPR